MIKPKKDFKWEQIPHRLIAKNTKIVNGNLSLPHKFQWIKELLIHKDQGSKGTSLGISNINSQNQLRTLSVKNKDTAFDTLNMTKKVCKKKQKVRIRTHNDCNKQNMNEKLNFSHHRKFSGQMKKVTTMRGNSRNYFSRQYLRHLDLPPKNNFFKIKINQQILEKLDPWVNQYQDEEENENLFSKYRI